MGNNHRGRRGGRRFHDARREGGEEIRPMTENGGHAHSETGGGVAIPRGDAPAHPAPLLPQDLAHEWAKPVAFTSKFASPHGTRHAVRPEDRISLVDKRGSGRGGWGNTGGGARETAPHAEPAQPAQAPEPQGAAPRGGRIIASFGRKKFGGRGSGLVAPRTAPVKKRKGEPTYDPEQFIRKAAPVADVQEYAPKHRFDDFRVHAGLKANVARKGYKAPTPIQDQVIPHLLGGKDVVGIANTGTGKTAAFLLPLIDKVLRDRKQRVLIMAPTRELAQQIQEEFRSFALGLDLFSACLVGGASVVNQLKELKHRNEFIIGTPGRIKDMIQRKALDLSKFQTVVLDEADRMLDMGFIADMRHLLGLVQKERHTLFFSATLSREIAGLIDEFLNDPVHVCVKTRETSDNVDQDVVRVPAGATKFDMLCGLLRGPEFERVLVFGRTKHGVERLGKMLERSGFTAASIHGDKAQGARQKALAAFKEGKAKILVATDVAARGLDIDNVSHVINFDLPAAYEDYVHRIGRTGRAAKRGKALTFIEDAPQRQ